MKLSALSDEELIRHYTKSHQQECLELIYKRYTKKLYYRCLQFTRDTARAEDFTHDIFIRVFTKLDQYKEQAAFSSWLYSIAYNYCMTQLRTQKRLRLVDLEDNHLDTISDQNETDVTGKTIYQLSNILTSIPSDRVALLRLKYEEELDIKEIARLHNLKDSAVKMRLKRTRDQIICLYRSQYSRD